MIFPDTITLYHKLSENEWSRTVVEGVQWSDKSDKTNNNGKISVARYVSVTFPEGTYEGIILDPKNEEDVIVFGDVKDAVTAETGHRISDLMAKYEKSGQIKSVNDNSSRNYLKNKKVILG